MKILLTGRHGQVGWELMRSLAVLGEVIGCDRTQADFSQPEALISLVERIRPNVIVNAAAYTAVDRAESEEELATRINGEAVAALASAAQRQRALLIHYSTDYVFDGTKLGQYTEADTPAPLNAYGRSKLAGEKEIQAVDGDWLILRTSWVYASRGKNFLRTILRLAAEREMLQIVNDQMGTPTSARLIADMTAHIIRQATAERQTEIFTSGTFNLTAAGSTSWHDFAETIVRYARTLLPEGALKAKVVQPILSSAYASPTQRPQKVHLAQAKLIERFNLHAPDWRECVRLTLDEMLKNNEKISMPASA